MTTSALLLAALEPVLVGTAFERDRGAQGERPGGGVSLLWCTPTRRFRERHPGLADALDPHHPDGCTDLTVEVDDGRLVRVDIEMMRAGSDLLGRPIEEVLPALVDRLADLLSSS